MNSMVISNSILRPYLWVVLLCVSLQSNAQDTTKILFVGNSFTFFWNVPEVVSSIAHTQDLIWECRQSTAGGANWEDHCKGERGLETVNRIKSEKWDYVVLQNQSSSSIDRKSQFLAYGQKLIDLIRSVGAEPLLFTTWSYKDNPSMQQAISMGYEKLAKAHDIEAAPIGDIWANVRSKHPDLNLYHDNKHQSPLGTYLIALTFFKQLSGMTVADVPHRLHTKLANGETTYLLFIKNDESGRVREEVDAFEF